MKYEKPKNDDSEDVFKSYRELSLWKMSEDIYLRGYAQPCHNIYFMGK